MKVFIFIPSKWAPPVIVGLNAGLGLGGGCPLFKPWGGNPRAQSHSLFTIHIEIAGVDEDLSLGGGTLSIHTEIVRIDAALGLGGGTL